MSTTSTTNLGLVKPTLGTGEHADVSVINGNMDKLDAAVGAVDAEQDGSLQEQVDALKNSAYRYTNRPNITNLNQLVDNGVYSVYPGASNAPSSAWQAVLVMRFDNSSNYVAQLAIDIDGKAFCRSCISGVWGAWREL